MLSLLNQENIYTSNLPASFDVCCKKKKTAHHSLAYPDRGDIRKLLIFSLALSPIIARSLYSSCVLKCTSSSPAVWQVMLLALISISEVKGRDDIFCPAAVTVTYMLPVQDGTLLRGPPSLSSKLIMNQSVWNIYGCPHPVPYTPPHFPPCVRPIRASSVAPAVWVREASCIVISIFLCWSPAEASPAALSTHANLHSLACVGDGMLTASPACSQTYCCLPPLCLFLLFLLFFLREREGKVSWFLACQRRVLWGLHWLSPYHSRKFTACLKKW